MKLLAVETATEACSAALSIDGVISGRWQLAPKIHTKLILPMIDELMAEAGLVPTQLDALAFGCGPGSFTGVRIAAGVIQGIAFGADLPVVPVSTLAALAQDFFDHNPETLAFTAMDARMGELFWGVYQRNGLGFAELLGKESVLPAQQVEFPDLPGVGLGSGWAVYKQQLTECLGSLVRRYVIDDVWLKASAIARLGADYYHRGLAVDVEQAMPVYLRDKVAKTELEREKP